MIGNLAAAPADWCHAELGNLSADAPVRQPTSGSTEGKCLRKLIGRQVIGVGLDEQFFEHRMHGVPPGGSAGCMVGGALVAARAGSLAATGQLTESHADLLHCYEIATTDATDWRVRATTACAANEHLLGLQTEAHAHLSAALAELGDAESAEAVELMIELTTRCVPRRRFRRDARLGRTRRRGRGTAG
jgi:hypothetical protein